MRREVDVDSGSGLSAVQRRRSDYSIANAFFAERNSSCLGCGEWECIADSLGLSARQLQVVKCVLDGMDEASIGRDLP